MSPFEHGYGKSTNFIISLRFKWSMLRLGFWVDSTGTPLKMVIWGTSDVKLLLPNDLNKNKLPQIYIYTQV